MSTDRIIAGLPRPGPGQSARLPLTSSNVLPIGSRGDGAAVLAELLEERARAKGARAALRPVVVSPLLPLRPQDHDFPAYDMLDQGFSDLLLQPYTSYQSKRVNKTIKKWKSGKTPLKTNGQVQSLLSALLSVNSINPHYVSQLCMDVCSADVQRSADRRELLKVVTEVCKVGRAWSEADEIRVISAATS